MESLVVNGLRCSISVRNENVIFADDLFCKITGYSLTEIINLHINELIMKLRIGPDPMFLTENDEKKEYFLINKLLTVVFLKIESRIDTNNITYYFTQKLNLKLNTQ